VSKEITSEPEVEVNAAATSEVVPTPPPARKKRAWETGLVDASYCGAADGKEGVCSPFDLAKEEYACTVSYGLWAWWTISKRLVNVAFIPLAIGQAVLYTKQMDSVG
jgi:hypothetical protein